MALSAELEKVVSLIQDPAQREATRKRMTELEENGLRQSDYSKKMNELDTRERERAAQHAANLKWHSENQSYYKQALADRDNAKKEAESAAARLKQLEASASSSSLNLDDSDPMAKALNEARAEAIASKQAASDLEAKIRRIDEMIEKGDLLTKSRFEEEANRRLNAYGAAILEVGDYQRKHEVEYGKPLDRAKLLEASNRLGGDLEAAYKYVTEDLRIEKMRSDMRAEVEKEFLEKRKAEGLPLAAGDAPMIGALQQRVMNKTGDSTIDPSIKADGTGRLALAIAQEMRAEGKA